MLLPAADRPVDDADCILPPRPRSAVARIGEPAELRWPVPEPALILLGCQPWSARECEPCAVCQGWVEDLPARRSPASAAAPHPDPPLVVACGRCSRMDPRHDRHLAAQRGEAEGAEAATRRAERDADWLATAAADYEESPWWLSEPERRRLWLGNRGAAGPVPADAINRARLGQEFLRAIGQEPDWALILNGQGRVVGCHPTDFTPATADHVQLANGPVDAGVEEVWNATLVVVPPPSPPRRHPRRP